MKLKKIASLMLAGIMAVSMLAGCKSGNEEKPNEPETPVATGIASAVDGAIKELNKDVTVDVKSSDLLNSRLNKIFSDDTYSEIKANDYKVLIDAVNDVFGIALNVTDEGTQPATHLQVGNRTSAYSKDTYWYVKVVELDNKAYNIDAQTMAANSVAGMLDDMNDSIKVDIASDDDIVYDVDYTMYVYEANAAKGGDSEVPFVVALLKVDLTERV